MSKNEPMSRNELKEFIGSMKAGVQPLNEMVGVPPDAQDDMLVQHGVHRGYISYPDSKSLPKPLPDIVRLYLRDPGMVYEQSAEELDTLKNFVGETDYVINAMMNIGSLENPDEEDVIDMGPGPIDLADVPTEESPTEDYNSSVEYQFDDGSPGLDEPWAFGVKERKVTSKKEELLSESKKMVPVKLLTETIFRNLPAGYGQSSTQLQEKHPELVQTMLENEVWSQLVSMVPKADAKLLESVMAGLRKKGVIAEIAGSTAGALGWVKKILGKRPNTNLSARERANLARSVRQEYPVVKTDDEALQVVDTAVRQMTSGQSGLQDILTQKLPQERAQLMALARNPAEIANITRDIWKSSGLDNVEPAEIRKAIVDYIIAKGGLKKESRLHERLRLIR